MKRHARWLIGELPELVRRGVLDAAAAQRLQAHYAAGAADGGATTRALLAVAGALLMGFGAVLLLAHNWERFALPLRVAIAFAPLAIGQAACLWAVTGARGDRVWREAAAGFTALAFAAALALIGRIFHLAGDLDRFLLVCALAVLPLAHLLRALTAACLSALALAAWVLAAGGAPPPLAVLAAFAALLPVAPLLADGRGAPLPGLFVMVWAVLATGAVAVTLGTDSDGAAPVLWLSQIAGVLWLLHLVRPGDPVLRHLRRLGFVTLAALALIATFSEFWDDRADWPIDTAHPVQVVVLLAASGAALLALVALALRRGERLRLAPIAPVVAVWTTMLVAFAGAALAVAVLVANLFVLGAGMVLLREGVRGNDLRRAHAGLAVIAVLTLMRFLDGEWSFSARGVAFLAVGVAFLAASAWLRRRVPS
ncbi:DUF2157 domain-containing protein [Algiphilus sp.]|uniref:DUF2157 domain-containing protein n=1 Tax=Algiphilus sp. TaxID=1872431 RepID=UPI0025C0F325|nr:DUF2157 domain-containing protein [Algiphilus sp.]MCK5769153.1 DUF2157 domain-containing protein [Algiphilus sp.]